MISFLTDVTRVDQHAGDGSIAVARDGFELTPRTLVNAAGLDAPGLEVCVTLVGHQAKFGRDVIRGPGDTGIPGFVDLLGIESPGLTASLAIAERVVQVLS